MLEMLAAYWGLIPLMALIIIIMHKIVDKPTKEQEEHVKKWLLWAVTKAEFELGAGASKLKFARVYDMFLERFPQLSDTMTMDVFKGLVEETLIELNKLIIQSERVKSMIDEARKTDPTQKDGNDNE